MNTKRHIKFLILIFGGVVFTELVVFAFGGGGGGFLPNLLIYPDDGTGSINYYRPGYSGGIEPGQDISIGWRTFGDETFDIFTPEYCKKITHTGTTDIFIPTRTATEWNSFKNRTNSGGISVGSCDVGTGCDINSGYMCGTQCYGLGLCISDGYTFANECEMIGAKHLFSYTGTCNGCNPESGIVCGSVPCGGEACTDALRFYIFSDECSAQNLGAVVVDMSFCGGGA